MDVWSRGWLIKQFQRGQKLFRSLGKSAKII